MDTERHYERLLAELQARYGPLDDETLTGIVGFTAGGPVSLARSPGRDLHVTVELSLNPEQVKSSEGLNFELFSIGDFDEDACWKLFTAIGTLSLDAKLGDGHTIDVSEIMGAGDPANIKLELFSSFRTGLFRKYGLYRVIPV